MILTRIAARIVSILLSVSPAAAQPASTASPEPAAPPAPPSWTATPNEAARSAQIAATAKGGTTQFVLACRAGQEGISGGFARYQGGALRTDGQVEAVMLFAVGAEWRDAFSIRLRYVAANRTWVLAHPLSPIFLGSFSRGATLTAVNSRNVEIFTFDLTGSTAAARTMRATCGLS